MMELLGRIRGWWWGTPQEQVRHPFDVAHGVDTSGLYYADKLTSGHAHDRYSEGYYATAPSLFYGAMSLWMSTLAGGARVEDYTFADLGCGKGRAVLMASLYPFRAVRGIELSGALVRIARRNLRKWMRTARGKTLPHKELRRVACRDARVERGDVLGPALDGILESGGPIVLFLFNSFGAEVVGPLMETLARAAGGRGVGVDLIYVHPEHERLVAETPGIELL